jgi:hypothetical protein
LKIGVKLAKDPDDYAVNNPNKKIGLLLGAKVGDVIWYYKTDDGVSINPQEISIKKYKESLLATVKDALEILSHDPGCIFNSIGLAGEDNKGDKQRPLQQQQLQQQ